MPPLLFEYLSDLSRWQERGQKLYGILWRDGYVRCNLWLKVGHSACLSPRNREQIMQALSVFTGYLCQRPPELAFKSSQSPT